MGQQMPPMHFFFGSILLLIKFKFKCAAFVRQEWKYADSSLLNKNWWKLNFLIFELDLLWSGQLLEDIEDSLEME